MSDRAKNMLLLTLNKQLAAKFNIGKRQNKKRKSNENDISSSDPDYEPNQKTLHIQG